MVLAPPWCLAACLSVCLNGMPACLPACLVVFLSAHPAFVPAACHVLLSCLPCHVMRLIYALSQPAGQAWQAGRLHWQGCQSAPHQGQCGRGEAGWCFLLGFRSPSWLGVILDFDAFFYCKLVSPASRICFECSAFACLVLHDTLHPPHTHQL